MGYRLSLLEKSPIDVNESAGEALTRTLELARHAERWGYHRIWLAEHHNTPALAISSPEIVVAWILAHTRSIRVGSGGVMLQHYSPYKVAENFNLLAALAPGRVDLGVGKAPGGLPLATRALQQAIDPALKGDFAVQLQQLDHWLTAVDKPQDDETLQATPLPALPAQRFLLGASEQSAALAASLNWNFVFAAHLNGDENDIDRALQTYHQQSNGRRALLALTVYAADSAEQAAALIPQQALFRVISDQGQRVNVGSRQQAENYIRQAAGGQHRIEPRHALAIHGTGRQIHQQLEALQDRFALEEFVIDTPISSAAQRLRSLELLATARPVAA